MRCKRSPVLITFNCRVKRRGCKLARPLPISLSLFDGTSSDQQDSFAGVIVQLANRGAYIKTTATFHHFQNMKITIAGIRGELFAKALLAPNATDEEKYVKFTFVDENLDNYFHRYINGNAS